MLVVVVEDVVVVLVVVEDVVVVLVVVNVSGKQNPRTDPPTPPGPVIVILLKGDGLLSVKFIPPEPLVIISDVQLAVFPVTV